MSCLTPGSSDKERGVAAKNQLGEFGRGQEEGGDARP